MAVQCPICHEEVELPADKQDGDIVECSMCYADLQIAKARSTLVFQRFGESGFTIPKEERE